MSELSKFSDIKFPFGYDEEPEPRWTDDCQGKKDYDANLVRLSTRYWPRGGGFSVSDGRGPFVTNADQSIKPSAKASIVLAWRDIIEQEFEAETEEEVKRQVEEWAALQFKKICRALETEFGEQDGG